jgi:acetyl-CoA carboxylase alpha subunit
MMIPWNPLLRSKDIHQRTRAARNSHAAYRDLMETDATMDVDEMHGERSHRGDKATVDKEGFRRIDGRSVAHALRDSALSGVSKEVHCVVGDR